jgi:2-deoxy-D-gluconate 3-dehydrogenase
MITSGFLANNSKVYITARKEEALVKKAEELSQKYSCECIPVSGDISNSEGIDALVNFLNDAEPEGIDFLINNAGAAWGANYDDFPESGWDKVIDLNLKTPFFLTQKLTPLLEKKGTTEDPSRVVNIASIDGLHVPMMETYSYSASKSGIIHLTKHMAKTLINRNIIVNAIAPGPFDSHMLGKAVNFDYSLIAESVPRKRIGSPEDIAGLCMYLCSRAGAYTIGETITCDGGLAKLL